jgi:hypothetical protein
MEKKKIVKCVIDEDGKLGVFAIGLVESPAIQENWIALSEHKFSAEVDERRMLYGAAMVPNKYIYRIDEKTMEEFYVVFDADTIMKCAQMFLKKDMQHNHTFEHQFEIEGCTVVESWIVESEQDKSRHFGMNVPVGTWMLGVKVDDDGVWQKVKAQEIKGFSIEGRFSELQMSAASASIEARILKEIELLFV